MEIIKADKKGRELAVKVLLQGGVIAHPTDTCYGLAADIFNEAAVRRIADIKKTPLQKPLSVIVPNIHDIHDIATLSHYQLTHIKHYLPGPFTVIIPKKIDLKYQIFERTIGVRIPKHELSIDLTSQLSHPITTTSANLHGKSPLYSAEDVYKEFKNQKEQPDLILDTGPLEKRPPSKIINICGHEEQWLR